jgi:drug/metabolite transporter (DMT)-like permease
MARVKGGPILAAALAVLLWGATPAFTKLAVTALDPLLVGIMRTVVAAVIVAPVVFVLRMPLPSSLGDRAALVVSSGCGFVAFPILFSIGQRATSVTHAALILASVPLFTGCIAAAFERRWPTVKFWIGAAVALGGELILIVVRIEDTGRSASPAGDAIVLISGLCAALGYVAGGRLAERGYDSWGTTFWGVIVAGICLLPVLPLVIGAIVWEPVGWIGIAYLAVGSTIVGYVAWLWALGAGGITRIGLLQFFQPVVGVILAVAWLDEPLTLPLVLAIGVILAGVTLARRG